MIQQIFVFTKSCHSLIIFYFTVYRNRYRCLYCFYSLRKRLNLISFLANFKLPINIFKICFQNFTYKMSRQTKNVILEIVPYNDSTVFGIERRVRDEVKPNPKTVFPIILKKRVSLLPGFKCCFSKIILFLQ